MPKFIFRGGDKHRDDYWECVAPSLKRAIRMFRVGCTFPHSYSSDPVWEKNSGESVGGRELRKVALSSKPGAVVCVFDGWEWGQKPLAEIPPEAPEAEDFSPAMLSDMGLPSEALAPDAQTTALAVAGATAGIGNATRRGLETKQLELRRAMGALEQQKRQLYEMAQALRAELEKRLEQVWLIELFLGSKEEVHLLRDGAPAPMETKISVFQRVLCMDEELAVYDLYEDNPDRIGRFDITELEDFDTWLVEDERHLDAILPAQKGIRALRVRRKDKQRDSNGDLATAYGNAWLAEQDTNTYLLVRNGEQVYRLWVDVKIWPRLFPRATEFDRKKWMRSHYNFETKESVSREEIEREDDHTKRIQKGMKHFAAGFLVLNGLIQRSAIFYPLPPTAEPINVFKTEDTERYFTLVLDDEGQLLLGDGRAHQNLTWKGYETWLRAQLSVGVRVLWTGREVWHGSKDGDTLEVRTGRKSISAWPKRDRPYVVETFTKKTWDGLQYTFKYLPKDDVYRPDPMYRGCTVSAPRSRRVSFAAAEDELLPIDFLSWRVLEHLIHDRDQREDYERFFWIAFAQRKIAKEAADAERPFINLVLYLCGVDLDNEPERARCERLVRWWKLKVKMHRTVGVDEAKALRMIKKAFLRGDDRQNDPEYLLLHPDVVVRPEQDDAEPSADALQGWEE